MESELSPDKENDNIPPVPIKTYQWEDLKRAREAGGYPWTHLLKSPLEGEITAEDIIRESTPRRSMSREFTRSRTHSPVDHEVQKILNLDSSPGSSRKYGDEGEDQGVHIPNFSKEVSLEDYIKNENGAAAASGNQSSRLTTPVEIPKNISPKSILKRRVPDSQYIGMTETREKTKCCHPLVNKIKHLADKTLHKLERNEGEKSPLPKRKKNEDPQEIRQLKSSPGAVRRQKYSAIKLGDSDEMSKTMSVDTPPLRKKKEHIYEDIEEVKDPEKLLQFSPDINQRTIENEYNSNKENESLSEKKSIASGDPSLVVDDGSSLKEEEHIMEKLHKISDNKVLDEEMDSEEPNIEEIFQTQLDDRRPEGNDSPNITITEILDGDADYNSEPSNIIPIESSPSPVPQEFKGVQFADREWSKPSSDHEYEIIEKPSPNAVFGTNTEMEHITLTKTDDELSSTTSLERKYLQHTSDDEELVEGKANSEATNLERLSSAEALQKDIEDRFFVDTPSTVSRTECEISTSQVDSSALENLPLKRSSRAKPSEGIDIKIQQRIKEGTGKLKTQATKLKTKLKNIKTKPFSMPERATVNLSEQSTVKITERSKKNVPEKSFFSLPDRRKFSLPDRPKFKKINISEKLSFGDKKKFTLPERPKFNIPDLPKFKKPDISFPSLTRKKEYKVETITTTTSSGLKNPSTSEFEVRTYPRLFNRKKKNQLPKTSSSPTLNREDTPPPTFIFTRVKKTKETIPMYANESPEEPREYGNIDNQGSLVIQEFEETYDFDKVDGQYNDDEEENMNEHNTRQTISNSDISPSKQEYTHINELNNDEFFVRPRGISRENIQVREYLSDEIRQAFKIPKNVLAMMGSDKDLHDDNFYVNEPEADPELVEEDANERDDGYYTFPPVRPSRAKRKKKEQESIKYIDDSVNASLQFSEVDLELNDDHQNHETQPVKNIFSTAESSGIENIDFSHNDLRSINEYANDDIDEVVEYREEIPPQYQTLPMPPKRMKKTKKNYTHSSLTDFANTCALAETWNPPREHTEDIIVYRTEHEYIVPRNENTVLEQSPIPPRRNRSRSSLGVSVCDDDRTSHGAESLTLDTHAASEVMEAEREIRHESPGYATVDKGTPPAKGERRSKSRTPPIRRRKSSSSERKYYTVGPTKPLPNRPPRKKSSSSLMTLNSFTKRSSSGDFTQYVEIDEPHHEFHKDLVSGDVINKMKDRPLPPPPRPPRGPKRSKRESINSESQMEQFLKCETEFQAQQNSFLDEISNQDVAEIEVSTQTDPLPDDVDFELGLEENIDVSISSSLRDIVDEDSVINKSQSKLTSPYVSRPGSRTEKSLKLSDPKISELSKSSVGRTSPTVILVERRVSSPTRINEREEMLTEASLTVQHIDIDESQIPVVPPLPRSKASGHTSAISNTAVSPLNEERALERVTDASREVHLDNLVTQRLQVRDLDVGRLNVSELQASKILVSDIEGMTLQVTELDSKSGHISVSGIEFSQSVIDEIVKKFAEISTNVTPPQTHDGQDFVRPVSREEHTQTDGATADIKESTEESHNVGQSSSNTPQRHASEDVATPPQRPPPPDLTPLLYSYLQDLSHPPASFFNSRPYRERPFTEFHESQHQTPPPPTRRAKRKPAAPNTESSSDDDRPRPSPRHMPPPVRSYELTIAEAGAQFLRVCHNTITRSIRNLFDCFMSYISGAEDKKDVQMALVIFLVLIAGLIMFGLSDSRTIHHHHWEFFNPPDGKQ